MHTHCTCSHTHMQSFRSGLNTYLTTFAYKNASTGQSHTHARTHVHTHTAYIPLYNIVCTIDDLWAHLEKTSKKPVADVMSSWTQQLGYPVISVEARQVGTRAVDTVCSNPLSSLFSLSLLHLPTLPGLTPPPSLPPLLPPSSRKVIIGC